MAGRGISGPKKEGDQLELTVSIVESLTCSNGEMTGCCLVLMGAGFIVQAAGCLPNSVVIVSVVWLESAAAFCLGIVSGLTLPWGPCHVRHLDPDVPSTPPSGRHPEALL